VTIWSIPSQPLCKYLSVLFLFTAVISFFEDLSYIACLINI
jgi:hypothetical protein